MDKNRYITKLHSVFDLPSSDGLPLPGERPARIMLFYDRTRNIRSFQIVDKKLSDDVHQRIQIWLEQNPQSYEAACGISSPDKGSLT